jgi:hypothetical protein
MSALSCGVVIGSTTVKVTFVDECGHTVWTKAVPTPRLSDGGSVTTDALGLVPASAKERVGALRGFPPSVIRIGISAAIEADADGGSSCRVEPATLTVVGVPRSPHTSRATTIIHLERAWGPENLYKGRLEAVRSTPASKHSSSLIRAEGKRSGSLTIGADQG